MEVAREVEGLRKVLRKLERVSKQESQLRARALKATTALRAQELSEEDVSVATQCLMEYVDALDFMSVMWRRLIELNDTGSWEVHSDLVTRVTSSALELAPS